MPRSREPSSERAHRYAEEFGSGFSVCNNGADLYCNVCEEVVATSQRSQVTQHVNTKMHQRYLRKREKQATVSEGEEDEHGGAAHISPDDHEFNADLCAMLVEADIPFHKLNNPVVNEFFKKYLINRTIPDESTLRKGYLHQLYLETLKTIRKAVAENPIFVELDESTDCCGRMVAGVIVGALKTEQPPVRYFLDVQYLDAVNHSTMATVFNDAMHLLWPNGIRYDQVLALLTDSVRYMRKCGAALRVMFTMMLHIYCVVHGLHLVAEELRSHFEVVDVLVGQTKKVWDKLPISKFANNFFLLPGISEIPKSHICVPHIGSRYSSASGTCSRQMGQMD